MARTIYGCPEGCELTDPHGHDVNDGVIAGAWPGEDGPAERPVIMGQNPDGTWSESIPEPGWHSSWRTLFRWRPECWDCGRMVGSTIPRFRTREQYEAHWRECHGQPPARP